MLSNNKFNKFLFPFTWVSEWFWIWLMVLDLDGVTMDNFFSAIIKGTFSIIQNFYRNQKENT